jgi:hypothetical protein
VCEEGNCVNLAQDRIQLRAFVNIVPYRPGISWPSEQLLASQEELCSMELLSHSKLVTNLFLQMKF